MKDRNMFGNTFPEFSNRKIRDFNPRRSEHKSKYLPLSRLGFITRNNSVSEMHRL